MGRLYMHLRKFSDFLLSFRGLMMDFNFLVHSRKVHKRFPMRFLITTQFYPKLFGHSSSFVCISCNGGQKEAWLRFYFGEWGPKRCFYWGVPNVLKTLVMGQSMWFFNQKKKIMKALINKLVKGTTYNQIMEVKD